MPEWVVPVVIAVISSGAFFTFVTYLLNKRNLDRESKVKEQSSIVADTEKIREMYAKSIDDMEAKHIKGNLEKDNRILELEKENNLQKALLEQSRQITGELLITIEDMKKTVNRVGEDVTKITGDFGKFPLAGDRQDYGRRAGDKPKGEQ